MPQTKILIVDDSKDILDGMRMFLELKKYVVQTLTDAINILEHITTFNPDILILDIYLSGADGRELCKKLKESDETKNLKIILFSAATNALKDFQSYGADAYLDKPFGLEEISNKIEAVLKN
jgi:DNA-binding response OmpR family regulator